MIKLIAEFYWWMRDSEIVSIYHPEPFEVEPGKTVVTLVIDGEEVACRIMEYIRTEKSFGIKGDNIIAWIERIV